MSTPLQQLDRQHNAPPLGTMTSLDNDTLPRFLYGETPKYQLFPTHGAVGSGLTSSSFPSSFPPPSCTSKPLLPSCCAISDTFQLQLPNKIPSHPAFSVSAAPSAGPMFSLSQNQQQPSQKLPGCNALSSEPWYSSGKYQLPASSPTLPLFPPQFSSPRPSLPATSQKVPLFHSDTTPKVIQNTQTDIYPPNQKHSHQPPFRAAYAKRPFDGSNLHSVAVLAGEQTQMRVHKRGRFSQTQTLPIRQEPYDQQYQKRHIQLPPNMQQNTLQQREQPYQHKIPQEKEKQNQQKRQQLHQILLDKQRQQHKLQQNHLANQEGISDDEFKPSQPRQQKRAGRPPKRPKMQKKNLEDNESQNSDKEFTEEDGARRRGSRSFQQNAKSGSLSSFPSSSCKVCWVKGCPKADRTLKLVRPFMVSSCKTHASRVDKKVKTAIAAGQIHMKECSEKDSVCGICVGMLGTLEEEDFAYCSKKKCSFAFCHECFKGLQNENSHHPPISEKWGDIKGNATDWICWVCQACSGRGKQRARSTITAEHAEHSSVNRSSTKKVEVSVRGCKSSSSSKKKGLSSFEEFQTCCSWSGIGIFCATLNHFSQVFENSTECEARSLDQLEDLVQKLQGNGGLPSVPTIEGSVARLWRNDINVDDDVFAQQEIISYELYQVSRLIKLFLDVSATREAQKDSPVSLQHTALLLTELKNISEELREKAQNLSLLISKAIKKEQENIRRIQNMLEKGYGDVKHTRVLTIDELLTQREQLIRDQMEEVQNKITEKRETRMELQQHLDTIRKEYNNNITGISLQQHCFKHSKEIFQDDVESINLLKSLLVRFNELQGDQFERMLRLNEIVLSDKLRLVKFTEKVEFPLRERCTTLSVYHPNCLLHHVPDGHPELAERLATVIDVFHDMHYSRPDTFQVFSDPVQANPDVVRSVHKAEYLKQLVDAVPLSSHSPALLDTGTNPQRNYLNEKIMPFDKKRSNCTDWPSVSPFPDSQQRLEDCEAVYDTFLSPGTLCAAMYAAGAVCSAASAVASGFCTNAFCGVRPPGHHVGQFGKTETAPTQGFCILNSVCVAAQHCITHLGFSRVAIVDFDVHHGNGTEAILNTDKRFFFASIHVYDEDFFPGTGSGCSAPNILNIPLRRHSGSQTYFQSFSKIIERLDQFEPDFLFLSAGFDGHRDDPTRALRLVSQDFHTITNLLVAVAKKHCSGRIVSVLEGGYDIDPLTNGLRDSLKEHLLALLSSTKGPLIP